MSAPHVLSINYLKQTVIAVIRFLVQFVTSHFAFTAEMIPLASNVPRYLTLHGIIGWTGVCSQLEAYFFICRDIKDYNGIITC